MAALRLWFTDLASMWKLPGTRFTMRWPDTWHPGCSGRLFPALGAALLLFLFAFSSLASAILLSQSLYF